MNLWRVPSKAHCWRHLVNTIYTFPHDLLMVFCPISRRGRWKSESTKDHHMVSVGERGVGEKEKTSNIFHPRQYYVAPSSRFFDRKKNIEFTSNWIWSNFIWIASLEGNLIWDSGRPRLSIPIPSLPRLSEDHPPPWSESTFRVISGITIFCCCCNMTPNYSVVTFPNGSGKVFGFQTSDYVAWPKLSGINNSEQNIKVKLSCCEFD